MEESFIELDFPKLLSRKELYLYLEQYKQGDLNAREKIISHNIRLVVSWVSKKFSNMPYDKNELISIGIIGLIKSVDTFDLEKNFEFSTYATRCIDNEILMFLRKEKKRIKFQSIYTPLIIDEEGKEKQIEDVLEDETSDLISGYEEKFIYDEVRKIVYNLPDRDREVILLYFGFINDHRYTQKEIADKLNISRGYVCKLIGDLVNKIGIKLQNSGVIEKTVTIEERSIKTMNTRKIKSIYEHLNKYTREEINAALNELSDEEMALIRLRYGNDLDNPISSSSWSKEDNNKFYRVLIPKMKKMLSDTNVIKKEDFIKISELSKTTNFGEMLKILTPKEAVITCLKLGYINDKCFTTESIAEFLGIENEEVIETTKKMLSLYKENINQSIDKTLEVTAAHSLVLKKD